MPSVKIKRIGPSKRIDDLMANTYKIFCECPDKKYLYNQIANYYNQEPTIGLKLKFFQELYKFVNGPLSIRVEIVNKITTEIINPYNVYCPRTDYKSILDEIDIDFSDKDFHWL